MVSQDGKARDAINHPRDRMMGSRVTIRSESVLVPGHVARLPDFVGGVLS